MVLKRVLWQVVNEDNLMEAGGPLQASVRLLSGGDRDDSGKSITPEAQPQNRAQQLQLGGELPVTRLQCCPAMYPVGLQTQHKCKALLTAAYMN